VPALLIASWNVNSVRMRLGALHRFIRKYRPDVLCLQEIKVRDELFPLATLRRMGFTAIAVHGQKGYHGVAIASRRRFADRSSYVIGRTREARHLAVRFDDGLTIHNVYVPAGGPDPDPEANPRFAAKLRFLRSAARWMRAWPAGERAVLAGDFNVAPLEHDVWSHQKLRRVITHTPIEIDHLTRVQRAHAWVDVAREVVPPERKLYTWWSYRAPDWQRLDKGRRLDHIWVSPTLRPAISDFHVAKEVRGWSQPSDHAPILAYLTL
jgi:exodeoxyribonuclease-3